MTEKIKQRFKYKEDLILKEIEEYISSTYKQHYSAGVENIQTFDVINEIDGPESWRILSQLCLEISLGD